MSQQTLPCTPPPPPVPQNCRGWDHVFRIGVYKNVSKNVLTGKLVLFRIIQVKRPKNVFFQHIHSNPILIILKFLDNNEWPIIRKISTRPT